MKRKNIKEKSKNNKRSNDELDNSLSLETIKDIDNDNMIEMDEEDDDDKIDIEEQNNINIEEDNIFEKALCSMDENYKNGLSIITDYEPDFSINYPEIKVSPIPMFTPSTKLNAALQLEDKNECLIFYYTHKKTLYPTIYCQLIGLSGVDSIFSPEELNERDFIWAGRKSIIFTNQKNFINLDILIEEYINPIMKQYKKNEEEKNIFIEQLCQNILIQEYLTYEELFMKVKELNTLITEHKIKDLGLVIIDGINSINPQKVEFLNDEAGKNYNLKFYKYNISYKGEINSNKKKNRNSNENKRAKTNNNNNKSAIKENLYRNISSNNTSNRYVPSNEILQQSIVTLILNYREKFNFNLIITVFDYTQDNFYNLNISGKASYKEKNKNTYTYSIPELKKRCYFAFKLPSIFFPKKIMYIEPINFCVNYNENIFGIIINPNNTQKLVFQAFNKEKDDYRPQRISSQIEYDYK